MEVVVGLRVVRGPDWVWRDIDGGEGHVGTVVEVEAGSELRGGVAPKSVVVQWDAGKYYRSKYRCGKDGKFDLRVYDSAPAGIKHPHISCSWCNKREILGTLWKCVRCIDYYLCTQCYMIGKHTLDHEFERIDTGDYTKRCRLKPRYCRKVIAAKGIFPGAEVVRGFDWRWGDQDGGQGCLGNVVSIKGWENITGRSVADVEWRGSSVKNIYRLGHNGKVDLKCLSPVIGGYYYPEDLPVLGVPYIPPESPLISAGDTVRVELDPDLFMIAQEDHGGWNDLMAEFIGRVGVVATVQYYGDMVVRYSNNKIFQLNPEALTKVQDVARFLYGDVVRVLDDIVRVHELQLGHGEWNDDMALSLGQIGRVIKVQGNGDVAVLVNGRRWKYNPLCLQHAPGEKPNEDDVHIDVGMRLHLLALVQADCPDVVGTAAAAGDVEALTTYLQKYPHEVNTPVEGKGPLHIAITEGYSPTIVNAILRFHPDLEMEDENGERPLHVCAYNNNAEAARRLVEAGANVNSRDCKGVTALAIASAMGHCDVVKVLLDCRKVEINVQDTDGKTPLHSAVFSHRRKAIAMLLEGGADPALLNFRLFTPVHNATGFGFLAGIEEFLIRHPQCCKLTKDDGYTPLHVAAANGYCDVVSMLASHHFSDVNVRNNQRLTPLHIAIHEGHIECVERLVGYGADVNLTTDDGNTPLHLALGRGNMRQPSQNTPVIKQIEDDLAKVHGSRTISPNVIVGLFLVQERANIYITNKNGSSPLQVRAHDIGILLTSYAKDKSHGSFRGSLKHFNPFADLPEWHPQEPQDQLAIIASTYRPSEFEISQKPGSSAKFPSENLLSRAPSKDEGQATPEAPCDKKMLIKMNNPPERAPSPVPCFLCDENPANVKFLPCGHVIMCTQCACRAKKCPDTNCRVPVHGFSEVCCVCRKEQASVTRTSCSHRCCMSCVQTAVCPLCQTQTQT